MSANIWTPQAPAIITPWKWLANFATAGKGVVTDTGKRGVGSGGKAKAFDSAGECAECCRGCAVGNSCSLCTDVTPSSVNVLVSGLTICPPCTTVSLGYATITENVGFSVNDIFTLPQRGSGLLACQYLLKVPNAVSFTVYSDAACTTVSSSGNSALQILFRSTSLSQVDHWELNVQFTDIPGASYLMYDVQPIIVDGMGNKLCSTFPVLSNQLTTCGNVDIVGFGASIGTGGGATVSCVKA